MLFYFKLTIFSLLVFISLTPEAQAKRYVIPPDSEVSISLNKYKYERLDPNEINVLVWNMYKGQNDSWKRDYNFLINDQDILMLQEIYLDWRMSKVFMEDQEFSYEIATSFIDTKKNNTPSGVGTASNTRPLRVFWQRSKYREPFIKTPKMVMLTEYPIAGTEKTLLTANIHGINFVSSRKLLSQLIEIAKVFERHDGPSILAGDFNTWSKKKKRYLKGIVRGLGMEEVKFENDDRMRVFNNIIDYIFVKNLNIHDSRVWGEIKGSDHKAMEVTLSYSADQ